MCASHTVCEIKINGERVMTTRAIATVTLEVECDSSWNDATTMEQIKKQGISDAMTTIKKVFINNDDIRIIGDIKIKAISKVI